MTRPCCESECDGVAERVLYAGLPGWLCLECSTAFGGLSYLWTFLPFTGAFLVVKDGYWRTLWHFLRGDFGDDES